MEQTRRSVDLILLYSGLFFLSVTVLPFVFQSLLFMVNMVAGVWLFPVVLIGSLAGCFVQLKRLYTFNAACVWLVSMVILLSGVYCLCIRLYDFSYDGRWYHQDAVRLLAQGWNPVQHYLLLNETSLSDLYVNHYPKAPWITAGSIYAFTNKLESGKMMNWYGMLASACFCFLALKSVFTLNRFLAIVLSVFFVLNPVVIYQLFTFYVDGLMGSLILCLICLTVLFYIRKLPLRLVQYGIVLSIVFLVNIKFTAVVYVGIFAMGYMLFLLVYHRAIWFKQALVLGSIFIVGMVLLGYPTYVRNTIDYGHPFYPLMGKGNIGKEVAHTPEPANFKDKNRFEQFNLATFAKPVWSRAPNESKPKALFTAESFTLLEEYKRADPEMGGFGPLFAEVLLMVGVGLIAVLLLNRKQFNRYYLWVTITLVCSIIIIPAFWYARYVPQLWTLILLLCIPIAEQPKVRLWAYLILAFVLVNCILVAQQNILFRIEQTNSLKTLFHRFKQSPTRPIINDGWMESFSIKLKEEGVDYISTEKKYPSDSITLIPNADIGWAFYVNSSLK